VLQGEPVLNKGKGGWVIDPKLIEDFITKDKPQGI